MGILRNQADCNLMIWECDQKKRNTNNVIKVNVPKRTVLSIGDEIHCSVGGGRNSVYKITELIDSKPSSISTMNYITAKTEWFLN